MVKKAGAWPDAQRRRRCDLRPVLWQPQNFAQRIKGQAQAKGRNAFEENLHNKKQRFLLRRKAKIKRKRSMDIKFCLFKLRTFPTSLPAMPDTSMISEKSHSFIPRKSLQVIQVFFSYVKSIEIPSRSMSCSFRPPLETSSCQRCLAVTRPVQPCPSPVPCQAPYRPPQKRFHDEIVHFSRKIHTTKQYKHDGKAWNSPLRQSSLHPHLVLLRLHLQKIWPVPAQDVINVWVSWLRTLGLGRLVNLCPGNFRNIWCECMAFNEYFNDS